MKTYTLTIRNRYSAVRDVVFVTAACEDFARAYVIARFDGFDILRVSVEDTPFKYAGGFDAANMNHRQAVILLGLAEQDSHFSAWNHRGRPEMMEGAA